MKLAKHLYNLQSLIGKIFLTVRENRVFRLLLIILSVVYPIIMIIISREEIKDIDQISALFVLSIAIIYIISTVIQLINWVLIIKLDLNDFFIDVKIFFQTLLMQRLPGGFWQWVGRINLYKGDADFSSKKTLHASIYERVALVLSGAVCYFLFVNFWIGFVIFALIYPLLVVWRKSNYNSSWKSLVFPLIHVTSYVICWILGGIILSIIINYVNPDLSFSLIKAVPIWTLTGIISLIFFFLPGGLGIREISLTTLLMSDLSFSQAVLIALLLRMLFLFMDLFLGLFGGLVIKSFSLFTLTSNRLE